MKVLAIIPAYNEEESIENVVKELKEKVPECDYVVINDCSKDHTREILERNNMNYLDLPVNLGLQGAVQTGYKYAYYEGYDAAVQFDGDGQHLPEYIPALAKEIENGYDIVVGSRFVDNAKEMSARMIGSRLITLMIKLTTGKKVNDPTSGMRMLNRKMLKEYGFEMNRSPEPDTLAFEIKKGAKVKEVQVEMRDRQGGVSTYANIGNSIKYMFKVLMTIIFFN
ncbi:Glycosyltransferase involved in cell wall bisynthesis [Kandleria vitulina]|uniref:glycosyltransferase family 2 protein n=1 Tax=Kandleria vitulina TaxID=1630 RepID=UPI000882C7E1|nr:glycosyltransferase family 2 protein [Kandleria vitulina]SDM17794.1 Glycosyltransferase involved in cell wall bisynthesis [Kandleria vitulina]